jgi:hypothetical protein
VNDGINLYNNLSYVGTGKEFLDEKLKQSVSQMKTGEIPGDPARYKCTLVG